MPRARRVSCPARTSTFPATVGRTYLDSDPAAVPAAGAGARRARRTSCSSCSTTPASVSSARSAAAFRRPRWIELAAEGLRYNRFHTTALCSPTRAALHHRPQPSLRPPSAASPRPRPDTTATPASSRGAAGTVGEVLRQNGYMTAWIGKNHNTPTWEASAAGPFDRWANGLGFDYFYGFNAGDMNHWNPILFENRNLVPALD